MVLDFESGLIIKSNNATKNTGLIIVSDRDEKPYRVVGFLPGLKRLSIHFLIYAVNLNSFCFLICRGACREKCCYSNWRCPYSHR